MTWRGSGYYRVVSGSRDVTLDEGIAWAAPRDEATCRRMIAQLPPVHRVVARHMHGRPVTRLYTRNGVAIVYPTMITLHDDGLAGWAKRHMDTDLLDKHGRTTETGNLQLVYDLASATGPAASPSAARPAQREGVSCPRCGVVMPLTGVCQDCD